MIGTMAVIKFYSLLKGYKIKWPFSNLNMDEVMAQWILCKIISLVEFYSIFTTLIS
jgi:hypothetical protein